MASSMSIDDAVLGETRDIINLASWDDNAQAALQLTSQARYTVDILTWDLDPASYNRAEFVQALTRVATGSSRRCLVRILVQDARQAVKHSHQLIPLAQRLTSRILIRKPPAHYRDHYQAFLVTDGTGFLQRNLADRPEGTAQFNAPREARGLLKLFTEIWEVSNQDPELRRLHL